MAELRNMPVLIIGNKIDLCDGYHHDDGSASHSSGAMKQAEGSASDGTDALANERHWRLMARLGAQFNAMRDLGMEPVFLVRSGLD